MKLHCLQGNVTRFLCARRLPSPALRSDPEQVFSCSPIGFWCFWNGTLCSPVPRPISHIHLMNFKVIHPPRQEVPKGRSAISAVKIRATRAYVHILPDPLSVYEDTYASHRVVVSVEPVMSISHRSCRDPFISSQPSCCASTFRPSTSFLQLIFSNQTGQRPPVRCHRPGPTTTRRRLRAPPREHTRPWS